jgi:multidrug efflux system membrane fusion protein
MVFNAWQHTILFTFMAAIPMANQATTQGQSGPQRGKWWLWLLVLAALAGTLWWWLHRPASDTANPANPANASSSASSAASSSGSRNRAGKEGRAVPVVVASARSGDINVYLNGLGAVQALNLVTVKSRIDGQLMKVLIEEGQVVKSGQVLAEIDARAFQVQLAQAQGQMLRDTALLKNARTDATRYRTLLQQDSISKQQLDTQDALVQQYEGLVKVDQSQIDSAKLNLDYARITAPISGRVGLRQVDPGNIVRASDANGLFVIAQLQPVNVLFSMPEDRIPDVVKKMQGGSKLAVDVFDRTQKVKLASGQLTSLDNQIDATTGTVKLKAQFANQDMALFPNQFVNARVLLETRHAVTIIPNAAIARGNSGTFVYVLQKDQTVAVRPVTVGAAQDDDAEILSGLTLGEQVVVDGADKLRDGARVELAQAGAGRREGKGLNAKGRTQASGKSGS